MRKRIYGAKLSRGQGARRALFRSLIRALVAEGTIVTTKAKTKVIQSQIEKLVNLAKEGGLSKRRKVYALLGNDRRTTDDIFNKIAKVFADRVGGYTRVVNLAKRRGDAAEMARLEWVKEVVTSDKRPETRKRKKEEARDSSSKKPRTKLSRKKTSKRETGVRK